MVRQCEASSGRLSLSVAVFLIRFLRWLFRCRRKHQPVRHLKVIIVMQTATLAWTDPTQSALLSLEVAMKVAGAPDFQPLGSIAPGLQTDVIPDLADGSYSVRVVAVYKTGRSAGITADFTVATPVTSFADASGLTVSLT